MAGKPKDKAEAGKRKPEKVKRKSNAGAKGKYSDDFPLLVEGYARRRMTDIQICECLGISQDTFYQYKKKYSEFSEALKKGRKPIDIEVENALLKNALGYDYEETHTEILKITDKAGNDTGKQHIKKKIVKKHQSGNLGAQIFWLINRLSDIWKQRKEDEQKDNMEEIKATLAEFVKAL
jgi:transcriptional regulator with XRE-family HTH domain